ncbi:MAG TPA: hypothetical protein VFU60_19115 [Ktedonobacterales bacterium]|nr:hypothetical protein [Ktedonobacterales bacterium]
MSQQLLSPADIDKLVGACRGLPPGTDWRIHDYVLNLMLTVLDYQNRRPTVEHARQHYEQHHWDEIRTHADLKRTLDKYSNTKEGNIAAAQYLWGMNHWTRLQQLRGLVDYFKREGVLSQQDLEAWAQKDALKDPSGDYLKDKGFSGVEGLKGLGYAIYQWLRMRQGADAVKPDSQIHKFVGQILGRPVDNVPDQEITHALVEVAHRLGLKGYELDFSIWDYMQASSNSAGNASPLAHPSK